MKYTVKPIKVAKDLSFRDDIAALVLAVSSVFNQRKVWFFFQSIENGTTPAVTLPLGQNIPSVRMQAIKPNKEEAVARHQSRFK